MRGINLKLKVYGLFISGLLLSGSEAIGSPQQDKFDAGLAALERQHYATAVRAWSEIAISGSPTAQNNLGLLYEQGLGVTQNFLSAMEWYEKAEEAGSLEAAHNIGMLYVHGKGVSKSWSRALHYFSKAEIDLPDSRYMVGLSYFQGEGQIQNRPLAFKRFLSSALNGYSPAQYMTAFMYLDGKDVERSVLQGYAWAKLASLGEADVVSVDELLIVAESQLSHDDTSRANLIVSQCTTYGMSACKEGLSAL